LWLIKVWFSASTFVVKIATFAKPETVIIHFSLFLQVYIAKWLAHASVGNAPKPNVSIKKK
jgi:hypothetical protein